MKIKTDSGEEIAVEFADGFFERSSERVYRNFASGEVDE